MARISTRQIARLSEEFGPTLERVVALGEDDKATASQALQRLLSRARPTRAILGGRAFTRIALNPADPDVQALLAALVRTCPPQVASSIQAASTLGTALIAALPRRSQDIRWYQRVPDDLKSAADQACNALAQPTTEATLHQIASLHQRNEQLRSDWVATFQQWLPDRDSCLRGLRLMLPATGHPSDLVLIRRERVAQIQSAAHAAGRRLLQLEHELPVARAEAQAAIEECRLRTAAEASESIDSGLGVSRTEAPGLHDQARALVWAEVNGVPVSELADTQLRTIASDLVSRAAPLADVAVAPASEVDHWRRICELQRAVFNEPPSDTLLIPVDDTPAGAAPAEGFWSYWYNWLDSSVAGRRLQGDQGAASWPQADVVDALAVLAQTTSTPDDPPLTKDPRPAARAGLSLLGRARDHRLQAEGSGRTATRALLRAEWTLIGRSGVRFFLASQAQVARDVLHHATVVHRSTRLESLVPESDELAQLAESLCAQIDSLHPIAIRALCRLRCSERPASPLTRLSTLLSGNQWTTLGDVNERIAATNGASARLTVEDAAAISKVIEEWGDSHYLIQVVSPDHIEVAIRLRARIKGLIRSVLESANQVRLRFAAVQSERVESDLRAYPLEKLRDTTQGRLNLTPIAKAGIRTVYEVRNAGMSGLTSLPGVGYQTAAQVTTAAERLAASLTEDMGIRIDLDPSNEKTTRLLACVYGHLDFEPFEDVSQTANEWLTTYARALEAPASDTRIFRILRSAANPLVPWVGLELFAGSDKVLASNESGHPRPALPKAALWEHFQRESPRYYQALSRVTGIPIDIEAEQGHLPTEIADAVRAFRLDRSLLNVSLREYQVFGAKYALVQRRTLLGDEMGLGKTIQALAVLAHLAAGGADRFLVICPVSVLYNWIREVRQRTRLPVYLLHGSERGSSYRRWLQRGGVAITSYGYAEHLASEEPKLDALVVDEAHFVKNPHAKRSVATWKLARDVGHVLFMSGTPLENRLSEFVRVIEPLNDEIAAKLDSELDHITPKRFREAVAPVYLRRNTEDVLTELPDVVEVFEEVELKASDRRHYLRALGASHFQEMRRAAFVDPDSAKLNRLKELASEAAANDRKIVVFTYFLDVAAAICNMFGAKAYGPITGQTPAAARQGLIDLFGNAKGPAVLVSQIVAGGTGLNIQAASVVVICEPQVKPTLETQAIGRVHRMGQLRSVQVHRLIAVDTVDERVLGILHEKRQVFDQYARRSTMAETAPEAIDISEKALADQVIAEEQARHLDELLRESLMVAPVTQPLATAPPRRSWADAIREADRPVEHPVNSPAQGRVMADRRVPAPASGPSSNLVTLVRADGLLLLPAREHGSTEIARTGVDLSAFRAFVQQHILDTEVVVDDRPRKHKCDAVARVNFQIIPSPDTSSDPKMVSIAWPPSDGRTALARHVGHLYSRDLAELDGLVHQIAERANAPIGCRGWVELHKLTENGRERIVPTISAPLTSEEERALGYSVGDIRVQLPDRSMLARIRGT